MCDGPDSADESHRNASRIAATEGKATVCCLSDEFKTNGYHLQLSAGPARSQHKAVENLPDVSKGGPKSSHEKVSAWNDGNQSKASKAKSAAKDNSWEQQGEWEQKAASKHSAKSQKTEVAW